MPEPRTSLIPPPPLLVRAIARATGGYSDRPVDLSPEGLMRRVSSSTGLDDFGDEPEFFEWLELVSATLTENPNLTPFSQVTSAIFHQARMTNKLRLVEYIKQHPEVLERPWAPRVARADFPCEYGRMDPTGRARAHRLRRSTSVDDRT